MSFENITEIIQCPFCTFSVWVYPNQETVVCEHCKTVINVNLIKPLNELKGEIKNDRFSTKSEIPKTT